MLRHGRVRARVNVMCLGMIGCGRVCARVNVMCSGTIGLGTICACMRVLVGVGAYVRMWLGYDACVHACACGCGRVRARVNVSECVGTMRSCMRVLM